MESPLEFEDIQIQTRSGERTVLVARPTRKLRLGRDRLARLREGDRNNELDDLIIDELQKHDEPPEGILMQCWDGADASWGFDEELDHEELTALGYHLMRGQLKLCRRALVLGTVAVCSTDLTPRDFDAVLEGWRRLSRELRDKGELERNLKEEVDLFLLDNFSLWTTRPMAEFRDQALASVFDLIERKRDRIGGLRERLMDRERAMMEVSSPGD